MFSTEQLEPREDSLLLELIKGIVLYCNKLNYNPIIGFAIPHLPSLANQNKYDDNVELLTVRLNQSEMDKF